ncbi:glycosyltransferase [Kluyvera ascorbata]|uniref:glycosyltransferase family 32 protein n=1 Tax=Kluyvera ascorbata TaxID=51288 RepID=UPI002AB8910A|nr:glycosyltransferase [Kluyvera ascorbata]MDZ4030840.1 glycosyltransferase [Kluyvera ascorbata]
MIPKKIHCCWFGRGEMPELALKCIQSWKDYLPQYEIILWNEDNFDINSNRYVREAYQSKKYAFVTDYVRLFALYEHGGIYMDTDVEVIQSLDKFLHHSAFTGCEDDMMCVTGTMASEKKHPWIGKLLKDYDNRPFILADGSFDKTPNTKVITDFTIEEYGWVPKNEYQEMKDGLCIYPFDVFCAKEWKTGNIKISSATCTVHHFSASWHSRTDKLKHKIRLFIGPQVTAFLKGIVNKLKK